MKLIKTIRNWLKAKWLVTTLDEENFEHGYAHAKWCLTDPRNYDRLFCDAYCAIFVNTYQQGVRKALCEHYQEQLKNEK